MTNESLHNLSLASQIDGLRTSLSNLNEKIGERETEQLIDLVQEWEINLEGLEVAEEELQAQNDELAAARGMVETERTRYQALFDLAPDGYLVTDRYGLIREANHAAQRMLGIDLLHLEGKPLAALVVQQDRRAFRLELTLLASVDHASTWESRFARRGSSQAFPVSISVAHCGSSGESLHWLLRDITDQVDTVERLRRSEERLQTILDEAGDAIMASILRAAGDGILAVDRNATIIEINPAAETLMGVRRREAIGRRGRDLVTLTQRDATRYPEGESILQQVLADGNERETVGERIKRKDGGWSDIVRIITPLRKSPSAQIIGAVEIISDVTERKKLELAKSEFLAMTSHELRTPLTAIHAAVGLSASGALGEVSEAVQRQLDIASSNSFRLISLVNDILTLEQIGMGKAQLVVRTIDLASLLAHSAELVLPLATPKRVDIQVEAWPAIIDCDSQRIIQVLTNLLSNAIKYTPDGSTIAMSLEPAEEHVVVSVQDSGPGIPPDALTNIFEEFQRVDSAENRQQQGTGLGLAIAKAIVEQHHGQIWVESTFGVGSTFRFTLPCAD